MAKKRLGPLVYIKSTVISVLLACLLILFVGLSLAFSFSQIQRSLLLPNSTKTLNGSLPCSNKLSSTTIVGMKISVQVVLAYQQLGPGTPSLSNVVTGHDVM